MKNINPKRIIISRTDSIGDVVLTLPMCIWLKKEFPETKLVFLCRAYTQDVVSCFKVIDEILVLEVLTSLHFSERNERLKADIIIHIFPNKRVASWAKTAKIPLRIGTSHRWFHWVTCNSKVSFTRKNSTLHEAQLNFYLLKPLGLTSIPDFNSINSVAAYITQPSQPAAKENPYIILHPLSQGSALDYPLQQYVHLAEELVKLGYSVYVSGTSNEGKRIGTAFDHLAGVTIVCGKFTLKEFIWFIQGAKALIACSTGPLHIAGIYNRKAVGLFTSRKPMHPGRWKPLGDLAVSLEYDPNCQICAKGQPCACIEQIKVEDIIKAI